VFTQTNSQPSALWPTLTAHQNYWEGYNCAYVYVYDPTDDGPEVDVCKAVLSNHTEVELRKERLAHLLRLADFETVTR
jgi:hypothetical protein